MRLKQQALIRVKDLTTAITEPMMREGLGITWADMQELVSKM